MNVIRKTLILLVALCFYGCAGMGPGVKPTYNIQAPFDSSQAENLLKPGTNTISANGLIRQNGGGVVTCAGSSGMLIPATKYAQERFAALYGSPDRGYNPGRDYTFVPDEPGYRQFMKQTTCDAQGNFSFEKVADGEFYVATYVFWTVGHNRNGGFLMQKVKVSGGETVKLVLTP